MQIAKDLHSCEQFLILASQQFAFEYPLFPDWKRFPDSTEKQGGLKFAPAYARICLES
jgi:hypothetical protein